MVPLMVISPEVAPVLSVLVASATPLPIIRGSEIVMEPPLPAAPDPVWVPPPVEIVASNKVIFSPLVSKVTEPPAPPAELPEPPALLPVVVMLPPESMIIWPAVVPSTPAVIETLPPA